MPRPTPAPVVVTNVAATVIAALGAGRYINLRALKFSNADSVEHVFVVYDDATEIDRQSVPARGTLIVGYGPDGADETGRPLTANKPLKVATLAAPTAGTCTVYGEFGGY
jgi:hypothetical protein